MSHLEQAKCAPQTGQNEAAAEKVTEAPPAHPPVTGFKQRASNYAENKWR